MGTLKRVAPSVALTTLFVSIAMILLPQASDRWPNFQRVFATEFRLNQTLSAGAGHLCAIGEFGGLSCWGLNLDGQIGDGTEEIRDTLTEVGVDDDWLTVSAGNKFTCGIRQVTAGGGSLWCWGANSFGQLGQGTTVPTSAPARVGARNDWASVSTGRDHACAITWAGAMYCWGRDNKGQIGNGTDLVADVLEPLRVGSDRVWARVSSGYGSTIAIDAGGELWAWGMNDVGQLGDGTTTDRTSPTRVGTDSDWAEPISTRPYDWSPQWWSPTSPFFSCALKTDGSLWCSGDNASGQFGDGTYESSTAFKRSGGSSALYATASAAESYMCGVQLSGSLWCWGWNTYATISPSADSAFPNPEQIGTFDDWVAVSVGPSGDLENSPYYFNAGACAMNDSGEIYCWGSNAVGQQGRGLWPRDIGGSWASVSAGRGYSCGIHSGSGVAECWGTNSYARLGTGQGTNAINAEPMAIANDEVTGWSSISTARYLTCGIASLGTDTGSAWCWGNSRSGGLGNGEFSGVNELVPIRIGDASCAADPTCNYNLQWSQLSVGTFSACGITTTHELWCWGEGSDGELGDGESGMQIYYEYYAEPHRSVDLFQVGTASGGTPSSDWIDIASINTGVAGARARCGIREVEAGAGTLWCWGGGAIGGSALVPTQVGIETDWTNVALGSQHACAIKAAGSLWCWGINNNGELGLGAVGSQSVPTQVGLQSDWTDIALGWEMTCGIRSVVDEVIGTPQSLYCWGSNGTNILGLPTTVDKSEIPVRVSVDFNPESVSMAEDHACVYGDGAVGCHGSAYEAQLGTWMAREGTSSTMLLPSEVAAIDSSRPTADWTLEPSGVSSDLSTLTWTLSFGETVSGLSGDDFENSSGFTATGCVFSVATADAGAGLAYLVTISGCSEGTIRPTLKSDSVEDLASNSGPETPAIGTTTVEYNLSGGGGGGGGGSPSPSATPSPTPSATPSPTPSATPSPTPSATPSPTPSATPRPSTGPATSPSPAPSPSAANTPSPTSSSATPIPSVSPEASQVPASQGPRATSLDEIPQTPTEKLRVAVQDTADGTRYYVNQRTSSSYLASTVPSLERAFSYPGVWIAGLLIAVALAFGAILLEAPVEWLKRQIKTIFGRITGYLKPRDRGSRFWKVLGVRADVLPFLIFGQLVASLNAPLDALPTPLQLLLGCVYGAVAALIIHAITKLPEIRLQRATHQDVGEMRAQWLSVCLAILAVGIGHLLGVVPGLVVGIYSARHFKRELSERKVAASAWQLSILLVLLSLGSWLALDQLGEAIVDPQAPLRMVGDAVLGTLVIAGSQGLVWTLVNPAEDASRTLRRQSLAKWFLGLAGGATMVVAILVNGGSDAGIFSPQSTLDQLRGLLVTGVVLLATLFAVNAVISRRNRRADLNFS